MQLFFPLNIASISLILHKNLNWVWFLCVCVCVGGVVGFGGGGMVGLGWGCEGGLILGCSLFKFYTFFFLLINFPLLLHQMLTSLMIIYFLYAELEDISWRRKAEGKNLPSEIIFGRKP